MAASPVIDRILINGHITTLDRTQPQVTALAISRDRIVAAGTDDNIRALAGPGTVVDNLEGRAVIPGLTDAHIHWEGVAHSLREIDIFEVPTKQEALRRVAERVRTAAPGEWLVGRGWTQDFWPDRAFPTAADLDAIAPNNPVYLMAKSWHAAWVNSAALRIAGITANTPDPAGGSFVRDASGQPTGLLLEAPAMTLVWNHIVPPTPDQTADLMLEAQRRAWAAGLTGLHDFDPPTCLIALQLLRERGEHGLRVVKNINVPWIEHAHALGLRWGFGDYWLRIGGLKIFADGALGPRTAHMIEPYEGEPQNTGIVVTDKEEMAELVSRASAAGLPSTIHAIGDRAVHDVLDVYEAIRAEEAASGIPRSTRRHRIEHVQLIHPDDVGRLGQLGVIASMQPIHATSDWQMADRYWGPRAKWSYNWRAQLEAGAVLAFGSDAPVEPFDPLKGIYAAVTRRRPDGTPGPDGWYPEGRLDMDTALRGFTQGPAYAAGLEHDLGTLAPGFLADLVVLDRDLFAVPPNEILATQVLGTMVGGEWKHRAFG
ncbi:MAG TPA: amidohydrolase [Aggregatilinea sp.]|uniref:amidohydrolase n=1 Tax=Aggregatilinea sp. TaxID=2806333 RepID=UPI002BB1EEC4|nr:amidohydrolase [Aggregatilinea sp.]HML22503.1 amidohydrolase [Aggregatilinea sp.]